MRKDPDRGYRVRTQLWVKLKMVADFDARVTAKCPLFVRGPQCGDGEVIIMLVKPGV